MEIQESHLQRRFQEEISERSIRYGGIAKSFEDHVKWNGRKKQVAEISSKKPYRTFKRGPSTDSKPPNAITNAESEEEEEEIATEGQTDEEEVVELQGMWDFILP